MPDQVPQPVAIHAIPQAQDRSWKDSFGRMCQHPGFAPTPVQQAFMDVIAHCVAQGVHTLDDLGQAAIQAFQIPPDVARPSQQEGDWLGRMVYSAKWAVEAKQKWQNDARLAMQLRLQEGVIIGPILDSGGRHFTAATVVSIDEDGLHYGLHAKRGGQVYLLNMSSANLKGAIDGSYAAGKRKTSFDQFVAMREHLPAVSVCADPKEPFYKDAQARELGSAEARRYFEHQRYWADQALDMSCRGTVGSYESFYGFAAHARAQLAEAHGLLACDPCFGGGPLSDHARKLARVQFCEEQVRFYQEQLDAAHPGWELRSASAAAGADGYEPNQAATQQVSTPSQAVADLARKINWHIGEKVVQATIKSGTRAIELGGRTQAWLDAQVARIRNEWATCELNSRVLNLAQAIHTRNPDVLVRTWAKAGHGTYGNEGSITAFREVTGLNLLRLSSEARAQALYAWANWAPDQIAPHQRSLADERVQRLSDQRRGQVLQERRSAIEQALKQTTVENGREVALKWVLDGWISKGFDELQVQVGRGVGTSFLINRSLNQQISLPKGVVADYVHAALEMRREAAEREQLGLPDLAPLVPTVAAEEVEPDEDEVALGEAPGA